MPLAVAIEHQRQQDALLLGVLGSLNRSWSRMTPYLDTSWNKVVGPRVLAATTRGQEDAARLGAAYVPEAMATQGLASSQVATPELATLVGIASDGRPLASLLYGAVVRAGRAMNAGVQAPTALAQGGEWLRQAAITQVSDAGRAGSSLALVSMPSATAWMRMVNPGACSRCIILAGRHYWTEGFKRHPQCRCTMIPTAENIDGDVGTDPRTYFDSLTSAQQDKTFGVSGAQAIRDGADMNQVVNARRNARDSVSTAQVYGRDLLVTTEGVTARGAARTAMLRAGYASETVRVRGSRYARLKVPRLMPESIYQIATDRADALRLLKLYGFIL